MPPDTTQDRKVVTVEEARTRRSTRPGLLAALLVLGAVALLSSYGASGTDQASGAPVDPLGAVLPTIAPPPDQVTDPWFTWFRVELPTPYPNLDSLIATESGFALVSDPSPAGSGTRMWFSTDGLDWNSTLVAVTFSGLAASRDEVIALSGESATRFVMPGWKEAGSISLPGWITAGYGSGRAGLAVGESAMVAQTLANDIYLSWEGAAFQPVDEPWALPEAVEQLPRGECSPPNAGSPDLLPLVPIDQGFLALIPTRNDLPYGAWPPCEPQVWMTDAGGTWEAVTNDSPFGPAAFVYDLAENEGRLVAVGGVGPDRPTVWNSDDQVNWEPIQLPMPFTQYELRNVASGPAGWIILGSAANPHRPLGWISTDAECWHPIPAAVTGRMAAVGSDRIVIADRIGQQTVFWVGLPAAPRPCPTT